MLTCSLPVTDNILATLHGEMPASLPVSRLTDVRPICLAISDTNDRSSLPITLESLTRNLTMGDYP